MQQFKEPSQIKEFDTITNIKKITIDLINPIVKKIEGHVSVVLQEGEKFREDNARLKNVADYQQQLNQEMIKQANSIERIREELSKLVLTLLTQRDADSSLKAGTDNVRAASQIDIDVLKAELTKKANQIEQLKSQKQEMKGVITAIKHALRQDVQTIQNSFREVQQQSQLNSYDFRNKSEQLERRLKETEELLQQQKTRSLESLQKLELYTQEREDINQKMNHLYEHIFGHVSTDEFDKYKKYQTLEIKSAIDRMKQVVDAALTPEIRRFLPTVIDSVEQLKKVDRLESVQAQMDKIMNRMHLQSMSSLETIEKKLVEKFETVQTNSRSTHETLSSRIDTQSKELQTKISSKLDSAEKDTIVQKIDVVRKTIEKEIAAHTTELQSTLTSKMQNIVKDKKQEIFQAVRTLVPQEQVDFFNLMKSFMPKMEQIKNNVEIRCAAVETLAAGITETLEKFSNRITKIKTDLDMRHESLLTDIKYLQKNREENNARFEKVGLSLSTHSEMITILTTHAVHLEAYRKKVTLGNQVFVSLLDGLVYELKPNFDEDIINYRKKPINRLDLMRASLTCFLSYIDGTFSEEFLNWKFNKPSNYFRNSVIDQLDHEKLKQQLSSNANRAYVSISPLDVNPRQPEQPSTMTINTERQGLMGAVPPSFSRTTDGLKKIITTTNKPKKQRYEQEMNTTTAKIRGGRNRGLSQL